MREILLSAVLVDVVAVVGVVAQADVVVAVILDVFVVGCGSVIALTVDIALVSYVVLAKIVVGDVIEVFSKLM